MSKIDMCHVVIVYELKFVAMQRNSVVKFHDFTILAVLLKFGKMNGGEIPCKKWSLQGN